MEVFNKATGPFTILYVAGKKFSIQRIRQDINLTLLVLKYETENSLPSLWYVYNIIK